MANYYGGTGNDLVLEWAYQQPSGWGGNDEGQLGNNSTTDSSVPVLVNTSGVLSGKTVVAVAAGDFHSLAVCSDGKVATWGDNGDGRLGNNSTTDSSVPVQANTSGVLSGKIVVAVAAGCGHSLALCSDGKVAAWGRNTSGQLGNNSTTSSVPVLVNTSGVFSGKAVAVLSAGYRHSIALAATPLSSTCTLFTLGLSAGTLNPAFSQTTLSYTAVVPYYGTASITVMPTTSEAKSSINVNGTEVTSGTTSQDISLTVGTNSITIQITAEDATNKTYTVAVTRKSNDSSLSGLAVTPGSLALGFSGTMTAYNASVSSGTTSIMVTPATTHASATITVNGSSVASGAGKSVGLAVGNNTITIQVAAQDTGYSTTYTLTVFRPSAICTLSPPKTGPPPKPIPSP